MNPIISFKTISKILILNSFFLKETTPAEVQKLLNNLNTRKASYIYGISPKLVKISSERIKKCLSQIVTASFHEGIVPDKLKSAVIYPIDKGDTKMLCSNYRPISILPIFSKILEKLMHKRLNSILDRYNILYKHQYGFQRGKSTEHAILDLHTNIIKAVESREKSCSILLDFAKAFDTVNRDIILEKLKYYGIRGLPLNWFKS